MNDQNSEKRVNWTKEKCREVAAKYAGETKSKFHKEQQSCYQAAKRITRKEQKANPEAPNFFDDLTSNMIEKTRGRKKGQKNKVSKSESLESTEVVQSIEKVEVGSISHLVE